MLVLVHYWLRLSNISSISHPKQGVPTTSMSHIDLLSGQWVQCFALGFSCWGEVHLRFIVYCGTMLLVTSSEVFLRAVIHFYDEGKLPLIHLILNRRYVKKSLTNFLVCDSIFFQLYHFDSRYPPGAPIKEKFQFVQKLDT